MKQRSHYLSASQQTNRRNNEDPNNTRVIASDTSILDFSVDVASSIRTGRGGGGGAMSRVQAMSRPNRPESPPVYMMSLSL